MSELKRCPFCGSDNINHWFDMKEDQENRSMFFGCSNCGSRGPWHRGFDGHVGSSVPLKSLEDWNNRPTEQALEARIAELEAELFKLQNKTNMRESGLLMAFCDSEAKAKTLKNRCERYKKRAKRFEKVLDENKRLQSELAQAKAAAVQWVTYDGSTDTLPMEDKWVLVMHEGSKEPCPAGLDYNCDHEPVWLRADENNWMAQPGDRWAYLPTPTDEG